MDGTSPPRARTGVVLNTWHHCLDHDCCHKCARFVMQQNELSLVRNKIHLKLKKWVKKKKKKTFLRVCGEILWQGLTPKQNKKKGVRGESSGSSSLLLLHVPVPHAPQFWALCHSHS